MATVRLFPPPGGAKPSINLNGRSYACAANGTIDVPMVDAKVMMANGWTKAADQVGTTALRLASKPNQGSTWHDTTLNVTVVFEGVSWRNPATGAVV